MSYKFSEDEIEAYRLQHVVRWPGRNPHCSWYRIRQYESASPFRVLAHEEQVRATDHYLCAQSGSVEIGYPFERYASGWDTPIIRFQEAL